MEQAAPNALVRLREADVVRLCGLAAAARGIALASRHTVGALRRKATRLSGAVAPAAAGADSPEPNVAVWVELTGDDATPASLRWGCSQHSAPASDVTAPAPSAATAPDQTTSPAAASAGRLGCEHVAALLTTWIRAPADFQAPPTPSSPALPALPALPVEVAPGQVDASHTPPHAADSVIQPRLLAPPRAARSPQPQRPAGNTLADELNRLNADAALTLARRVLGAEATEPSENAAQEARRQLAAAMSDPALARTLVGRLEAGARALLADLLLLGGAITATDLDAYAQRAGRAPAATRADMAILERHGLVFPASGSGAFPAGASAPDSPDTRLPIERRSERSWGDITGWRMPPEIRSALPIALPAPQGEPPRGRLERSSPRPLMQALALLARAPRPLGVSPVEVGAEASEDERRGNRPPAAAPAAIGKRFERRGKPVFSLVPGDLPPALLHELARGANAPPGAVRLARRLLLWAREERPGQPITDLASVPADERALALRAAFRLWRSASSAGELADLESPRSDVRLRLDAGSPAFHPAAFAAEAAAGRAFAVDLIAHASPGVWYPLADWLALVWRINPLFLRGRQQAYSSPAWWIERIRDARPLRPAAHDEWLAAEGAYLRALIEGPLRWWGALDLLAEAGATPVAAPLAFRLTPFGAWLLAGDAVAGDAPGLQRATTALQGEWGPAALPTREAALAVQPLAAGASTLLAALDHWALPTSVAGGRLIYTFTPERACAAFDAGAQPDELLAAMRAVNATSATSANGGQERGGGRIPDRAIAMIGERLSRWRAAYGQARIETGLALLEARDEATLIEALTFAPEIAARCRRIAPGVALIPPTDLAALRALLTAKGYHV